MCFALLAQVYPGPSLNSCKPCGCMCPAGYKSPMIHGGSLTMSMGTGSSGSGAGLIRTRTTRVTPVHGQRLIAPGQGGPSCPRSRSGSGDGTSSSPRECGSGEASRPSSTELQASRKHASHG